jgi:3-oxoacyl-[acyl-carrier-protein] synthase-3
VALVMPMERVILGWRTWQYVGGIIPLALDLGIRDGRLKPGELLLLEAFGGGFTWGSALVRL